jgi:hypothetical protein
VPHARFISVDLQTIRWSDPKRGVRYVFLTPAVAQQDLIIPFDQGEECKPISFRMRPAFVTRSGPRRTHAPDNEQLKDAKLKVACDNNSVENGASEAPSRPLIPYAGKERKPRQRRAKISETKLDGTIPTTLGGKLPPVSVLARRAFGLRQIRR